MTKVIAYTALHYGRDFLASAIRSVIDYVDEMYVIYTPVGSHGHRTDAPCPESQEELFWIANDAAQGKLHWREGYFTHEGQQRDAIYQYAPDADVILTLDADEIWPPELVKCMVNLPNTGIALPRRVRVPMIHFWRSLYRAVLHDPAYPERLWFRNAATEESVTLRSTPDRPIAHMGYAQRSEIVGYKLLTHGHKNEFRRDCDWFHDIFMTNRQHDCHPVGSEYWNMEAVDPLDYLPEWMIDHPYYGLEVIP